MSGESFILRTQLAKLAAHHGIAPEQSVSIALAAPAAEDLIVEGLASTGDVDLTRMRFAPRALTWSGDCRDIPLLISHDSDRVAGEILQLKHIADGLWVKARVTNPKARQLGAFSIGGRVDAYTLHNEASRDFYGEVTRGAVLELSMTSSPANPKAIVQKRYPVPRYMRDFEAYRRSVFEMYGLQVRAVNVLRSAIDQLAEATAPVPDAQPRPSVPLYLTCAAPRIYGPIPPRPSRPQTEFSRLADAMSQMTEA